jgi:hypothetical protein
MTKEQLLYNLAQQIFLKKIPYDYLNDKSKKDYENKMDDAIAIAKLFFERVEKDEQNN